MVAGNQDITSPQEGQSSFPYAAVIKGGRGGAGRQRPSGSDLAASEVR